MKTRRLKRKRIKVFTWYSHPESHKTYPFLKLTERAKWSLFEALFVGLIQYTKSNFQSMCSTERTEQLYNTLTNFYRKKEWRWRLFLFVYQSEITFYNLGILNNMIGETTWKKMSRKIRQWEKFDTLDIDLTPIITNYADKEYIKDVVFDILKFVHTLHKLPYCNFENFIYPNFFEPISIKNSKFLKKENWSVWKKEKIIV